jgi:branched-chain amino acid transport system permease protein
MVIINSLITSILSFSFLALATFGIVLIFKTSSTTNFAQGTLGVVGAYVTSYILAPKGVNDIDGTSILISSVWQVVLPMLGGILVSFILGLLIDVVIFRNAKYTNSATKQIITMGLVIVIAGLLPLIFGGNITRQSYKFSVKTVKWIGINWPLHNVITLGITIVVIGGLFLLLKFTKWGLGVRAVASNEKVAGLMGINSNIINSLTWGIAGALGALSAITYAASIGTLNSGTMIDMQLNAFYSSILGGFGTFYGPLAGGFIFTVTRGLLPNLLINFNLTQWSTTILYVLILVAILIKPSGLFGKTTIKKV